MAVEGTGECEGATTTPFMLTQGLLYEHAAGILGGSLTNGAMCGVLFSIMTDDESSVSYCFECK